MAAVRDPAFWRRFSVAVHNDDADKEARRQQQRPELKHSYVPPLSSPSTITSPPMFQLPSPTDTSQPLWPLTPQPLSPITPQPTSPRIRTQHTPTPFSALHDHHQEPSLASPKLGRQPSKLTKTRPRRPEAARLPGTRHTNGSQMTLGLSGRPPSRFKFWTSISANDNPRESWLEAQLKKKRQRTWMCWLFWLVFFALVAGVVIVLLLLKAKKII